MCILDSYIYIYLPGFICHGFSAGIMAAITRCKGSEGRICQVLPAKEKDFRSQ